eukprot:TRINITY_DN1577_c0_g1_i1.p1 TRINITY_DN1577_c0_g1~~TRINITY_DN1577_c0_g1_i1.p1  ORF type:complete len:186 (+),score=63.87 TRINITY_DN1577_c0_g1_i1:1312-1869(+)
MITSIRDEVLSNDLNGVLQIFFKYPNGDIRSLLATAIMFANSKKKNIQPGLLARQAYSTVMGVGVAVMGGGSGNSGLSSGGSSKHSAMMSSSGGLVVGGGGGGGSLGSSPNPLYAEKELRRMEEIQKESALRLESVVATLQKDLFTEEVLKLLPESCFVAVAQLKRIRDVMSGHIALEEFEKIVI